MPEPRSRDEYEAMPIETRVVMAGHHDPAYDGVWVKFFDFGRGRWQHSTTGYWLKSMNLSYDFDEEVDR